MIRRVLKAKHWQIFLFLFCLPLVFQVLMTLDIFKEYDYTPEGISSYVSNFMLWFPIIMLVSAVGFFGWFWSIALGFRDQIPADIRLKYTRFKILSAIPFLYVLIIAFSVAVLYQGIHLEAGKMSNTELSVILGAMTALVPLHLLSIVGIVHTLLFAARVLKTVELQREVTFGDFGFEFFMFLFYPIGIWVMQPRINRMIHEDLILDDYTVE